MIDFNKIFTQNGLNNGRMISFSKSIYRENNPDHDVIFNANVFTLNDGKIWYGDLDLTLNSGTLLNISKEIKQRLYVLREHDGRFENEELDKKEIKRSAYKVIG